MPAVMTNVVILNFCYDVPVKLYSSELLLMAVLLFAPHARRVIAASPERVWAALVDPGALRHGSLLAR